MKPLAPILRRNTSTLAYMVFTSVVLAFFNTNPNSAFALYGLCLGLLTLIGPDIIIFIARKRSRLYEWAYYSLTHISYWNTRPCVLVLGNKNSGKSQLLQNCSASLEHETAFNQKSTIFQSLWQNKSCYFIEKCCNSYSPVRSQMLMYYWQRLHLLITRYSNSSGIQGAVVVLSGHKLTHPESSNHFLELGEEIRAFHVQFPRAPIHLVLTHMDHIKGFFEVFQFEDQKSFEAPFGVFAKDAKALSLTKLLGNLYQKIEAQLITRIEAQRLTGSYDFTTLHNFRHSFNMLKTQCNECFQGPERTEIDFPVASIHLTCHSPHKFKLDESIQSFDESEPHDNHPHLNNNLSYHYFTKHLVEALVPYTWTFPRQLARLCAYCSLLLLLIPTLSLKTFTLLPSTMPKSSTAISELITIPQAIASLFKASSTSKSTLQANTASEPLLTAPSKDPNLTEPLPNSTTTQATGSQQALEEVKKACASITPSCIQHAATLSEALQTQAAQEPEIANSSVEELLLQLSDTLNLSQKESHNNQADALLHAAFTEPPTPSSPVEEQAQYLSTAVTVCKTTAQLHNHLAKKPDDSWSSTACYEHHIQELTHALAERTAAAAHSELAIDDRNLSSAILQIHHNTQRFSELEPKLTAHFTAHNTFVERLSKHANVSNFESIKINTKQQVEDIKTTLNELTSITLGLAASPIHTKALTRLLSQLSSQEIESNNAAPVQTTNTASMLKQSFHTLLLHTTSERINSDWKQYYAAFEKLRPYYPFQANAEAQNIEEFHAFFAANSPVQQFLQDCILPLTHLTDNETLIQWNYLNGSPLFIGNSALDFIMTYQMIQHMFYSESSASTPMLEGELSVAHSSGDIDKVLLSLDNIDHEIPAHGPNALTLRWPNYHKVQLKALGKDQKAHILYQKTGPWALLHMLQILNNSKDAQSPHTLALSSTLDNLQVNLTFETKAFTVPLTHDIISRFTVPENLLVTE